MKNAKKGLTVFSWIVVVFCVMSIFVYGANIGSVILAVVAILALPVKKIRELWGRLGDKFKWVKPVVLTILFFSAVSFLPVSSSPEETATEIVESVAVNEETETDSLKETVAIEETSSAETETQESTDKESEAKTEAEETKKNTVTASTQNTSKTSSTANTEKTTANSTLASTVKSIKLSEIPSFDGKNYYIAVNNNVPFFTDADLTTKAFETYSSLDSLGRCGVAYANICKEIMPTEERGSIGSVKPTGWQTIKYDIVDGKYLYNRCHLIGFQLSGENANPKNLITGTRYFNTPVMLQFEDMVADYVKETNKHVLYRVTPMFDGKNLIASGVLMEAESVEDAGKSISFNVFCYNVQPGVQIDYATGNSSLIDGYAADSSSSASTTKPSSSASIATASTEKSSTADTSQQSAASEQAAVVTAPVPATDNQASTAQGAFAVNGKNGKIHITGKCAATKSGSSSFMDNPIYFATYEEAEAYSIANFPNQDKRQCGNCW